MDDIITPDGETRIKYVVDAGGNYHVVTVPNGYNFLTTPPAPGARQGETQFYVPYTAVHPETAQAVPPGTVWVDVSYSDTAYFGALLKWWETGQTFAVIEHDIAVTQHVVDEFENCPEPWCLFGYAEFCHEACMEAWRNALGCTRFRRELIEAVPDAVRDIPRDLWDWHNLCDGLGANLRAAGFSHHWHYPPVRHHREVQNPRKESNVA